MRSSFIRRASRLRGGAPWAGPAGPAGPAVNGEYFGARYFAGRHFAPRYFDGTTVVTAAGDALQQLLDTMVVGEFKRLNTRNLPSGGTNNANMKSGPVYLQGLDIYTRTYYDAVYPGSPPLWANEGDQDSFIFGTGGGGDATTDNMRLGYSGVAFNHTAKHVLAMGGGHSSGGWTHGIIFDCLAAAQDILDAGNGADRLWDQYTDPAPYDDVRDTAWPNTPDPTGSEGLLWPQTISGATRTRLGPDPNIAPFALHNYGAICHDPATNRYYVGGGSVADNNGGLNPGAFWKLDPTTREWVISTTFGGGNEPFIVPPPVSDGNYMFMTGTGTVVVRYDIVGDSVTTIGTQGTSLTNADSVNPMWMENLTEAGKYDLVCHGLENVRLFTVHPKLWPAGAAQAGITYPVGNGGSTTADATYFTFEGAVTRRWDGLSGMTWVPDEQKIYVMAYTGTLGVDAALRMQTIDPFVGGATSAQRWHVDDWLAGSYTGDIPAGPFNANDNFGNGWQNKLIDLGADYKAFIAVFGAFGDVILIKRAT
jgi:hypothetical protein